MARGWLGVRRIGHLGTLDPQATGVLPLAVRGATKLVPFFQQRDKRYVGTVHLGVETDTLDGEGEVLRRSSDPLPQEDAVRTALAKFVGDIEQIPPMYSAVKRGGVPLHRLARQGEEVEREPKKVRIDRLELLRFDPPEAEIRVDCSAGTYVRTLAQDLGAALGCGAYLSSLRRLRSAPFDIEQALTVQQCAEAAEAGALESLLIPPEVALDLPRVKLAAPAVERLTNGSEISPGSLSRARPGTHVCGIGPDGRLVAVLELRADRMLWPIRLVPR
jgi:tRNA pseudouridine55 synthase